jgi:hypothetical protein
MYVLSCLKVSRSASVAICSAFLGVSDVCHHLHHYHYLIFL